MKNAILSTLFLMLFNTLLLGQHQIVVDAGVPYIFNQNLHYKSSYSFGLGYRMPISKRWYLQPGISYYRTHYGLLFTSNVGNKPGIQSDFYNVGLLGGYALLKNDLPMNVHVLAGINVHYLNMKLHYLDGRRYRDDILVPTFELGASWMYKISEKWSLALYVKGVSNIFPWSQDSNWCGVGRELGGALNPIKTYEKVIFNPGISIIKSW